MQNSLNLIQILILNDITSKKNYLKIYAKIQTLSNDAPPVHDVCRVVGSAGGLPY
jgi:hypothetical protein